MDTKMIGSRIARARKQINISQAQLAERLFISPQAVGKWERGESSPDLITLHRLAEMLGVDLNYFSENFQSTTQTASLAPLVQPSAPLQPSTQLPSKKQEEKLSWDMSGGHWVDADFSGLKNLHEKFSSSNLQRCQFIDSVLSGLLLKGNHVDSCDFRGSNISGSHWQGSHLVNNLFNDCSLKEAHFSGSHIQGCNFSSADLAGATFKSSSFQENTLTNAVLHRTSFIDTPIADTVFEGTLEDCYFDNCAFSRVTFQHATLLNTFFKGKSLKRIRFIDCQADRMTYQFLKNGKANLEGITLLTT
jgi:uncharacterized protein YjbI with pentapeptide repeats